MDLHSMTDEELAEHRIAVITEQERRASLAAIPWQVAGLAAAYVAAGGPQEDMISAVQPVLSETEPTVEPTPDPEPAPEA